MKTKKIISLLLAIVLTLGLSSVFVTAEAPPNYYDDVEHVTNRSFSDDIDGTVDEGTWGEPNAIFTRSSHFFTPNEQPSWTHVNITNYNYLIGGKRVFENQSIELYVRRAEEGIYLAVKFINAIKRDEAVADTLWTKRAGLDISIGTYDETYNVKRDANKELFRTYRLMEDYNAADKSYTAVVAYPYQNSVPQSGAKLTSYAIGYENRTYTYECIIPYDNTYILKDHDLVLSLAVRDAYVEKSNNPDNTKTFSISNVFNISDVCRATTKQGYTKLDNGLVIGDENTHPFLRLNPLRIRIDEKCYKKDTVAQKQGDISIDANVSPAEWGEPVIVTSPTHAEATWTKNGYWSNQEVSKDQRAKVYMTNDTDYLYVAATLDPAKANKNVNAANYLHPQMSLTLSKYDPDSNVAIVNGQEQFSYYRIGSTTGGAVTASVVNRQLKKFTLSDSDWEVRYDAEAETYFYELRIPLSTTNIDIRETTKIAVSIQIGDANGSTNTADENNRYNIGGTGVANYYKASTEGQYPHANQPVLVMTLNQNHGVTDTTVAEVGDWNFGTVAGALAVAKAGETVTLLKEASVDSLQVNAGVTLDLNGKTVTVSDNGTFAVFGTVMDSADGVALIQVNKDNVTSIPTNNTQMALYDGTGYRIYNYSVDSLPHRSNGTNAAMYGVHVDFTNHNAYTALAEQGSNSGLQFFMNVDTAMGKINNGDGQNLSFHLEADGTGTDWIRNYGEACVNKLANNGDVQYIVFTLKITGLESLAEGDSLDVKAGVRSGVQGTEVNNWITLQ